MKLGDGIEDCIRRACTDGFSCHARFKRAGRFLPEVFVAFMAAVSSIYFDGTDSPEDREVLCSQVRSSIGRSRPGTRGQNCDEHP